MKISSTKNRNKKKKIKIINKGGFTLIELLATISILSVVSVLVIFTATNVIDSAKSKSYQVSISNIEKNSGDYAIENQSDIKWASISGSTSEYFCVTVQDLIDMGYFSTDVLESEIAKDKTVKETDYIYLERDSTKTVSKTILLNSEVELEAYGDKCNAIQSGGVISFNAEPKGWSKSKDVNITYKVFNYSVSDYKYYYNYGDISDTDGFNGTITKKIEGLTEETLGDNNIINAKIFKDEDPTPIAEKNFSVNMIDGTGPSIKVLVDKGTTYTKTKEASVKLVDEKSGFKVGEYKIYYKWSLNAITCDAIKTSGNSVTVKVSKVNSRSSSTEKINITDSSLNGAGKLYTCNDILEDYVGNVIEEDVVSADMYLDNDRPIITLGTYTKTTEANGSAKLQLVLSDATSSIKEGSFTRNDLEVTVGGETISTSNLSLTRDGTTDNYDLVITNSTINGDVVVKIADNKVLDIAENGNEVVEFKPEITFNNIYKISYDKNAEEATGTMEVTECTYGSSCTLRANGFSRVGYTFTGWNTKADGSGTSYSNNYNFINFNYKNDITLYAQWRINKVYIKFHVNSGIVTETTTTEDGTEYTWTTNSSVVSRNGTSPWFSIDYGTSNNLPNYNNSKYLKITRTGYSAKADEEWTCYEGSGCTTSDKTYNQDTSYQASDFCDASNGDCTVTLKVNWRINKVYFKFHRNGGTLTSPITYDGTEYTWTETNSIIYRATITESATSTFFSINYGGSKDLPNADGSYMNVKRTGYSLTSGAEWTCYEGSGCSSATKTYSDTTTYQASDFCDASAGDCTVYLKANWKINTYTISYDANGGSGAPSSQTKTYGTDLTLSSTKPTLEGYTFGGWNTKADGSGTSYSSGGSYTKNASVTLYAAWESVVNYCTSGVTIGSDSYGRKYVGRICFDRKYVPGSNSSKIKITNFQIKTDSPGYFNLFLDGYIYINGEQAQWCNSKASGPQCLVPWYSSSETGYKTPSAITTSNKEITITGDTVTFTFKKYNYDRYQFVNGNYTTRQFTISSSKEITYTFTD